MAASNSIPTTANRPRLLYLTTEYPHVSHSFIRREILGLEELGYEIIRVAIKPGQVIVGSEDEAEENRTTHILNLKLLELVQRLFTGVLLARGKVFGGFAAMLKLVGNSNRGVFRHSAYFAEALVLRSLAATHRVDHIHTHFGTNAATIAYLNYKLGGPQYSITIHGPVEFDQPYDQSLAIKIQLASFIVAITSFCRSQIYRWSYAEKWPDIHEVGCSVGQDWFDEATNTVGSGLVCVGRLDEQKGQVLLVRAYANALKNGFKGTLTFIGDGPFLPFLQATAREMGVENSIRFMGWQDAQVIKNVLIESKALVLTSFAEGLPVVIMEAMALKRVVVTTHISGIPELVRDGIDGWLVTPGDETAITEALLKLQRTPTEKLLQMGRSAQQRVRERHETSACVTKLDKLFQKYADTGDARPVSRT